jgi:hypothetical protein
LRQNLKEELTIRIDEENLATCVPAAGHVVRRTVKESAQPNPGMVPTPQLLPTKQPSTSKRASHGLNLLRTMRDCRTQPRRPLVDLAALPPPPCVRDYFRVCVPVILPSPACI